MNTSRNNTSRNNTSRSKRKKAIPLYFQKSHSSLSDILQTASYKRRIKELLKNNKSLAVSLQDSKYRISNQQKEIEEYARTSTQVSHAQLKLKDMASTIQKLVSDLDEVRGFLDINSFNLMKNTDSSDHRLRIEPPDHSTIEESASRSTLDASALEEASAETPSALSATADVTVSRDSSMTKAYNLRTSLARVDSVLKGSLIKSREDKNDKNQTVDDSASISIQSPPTPQLEIPKNKLHDKLEPFIQNYTESPRKPLQALNSIPPEKNVGNAFVSKIPKVSKKQPPQNENLPPFELPGNNAHRRETFVVVKKPCNIPDISAGDRRGTFTVSSFPQESQCHNDRRGTYLVPPESVPPPIEEEEEPKSADNFVEPVLATGSALPNQTILLCEDMELTEIIPPRKEWIEETEMNKDIPFGNNKAVLPLAGGDVEFTQIVPVLEKPSKTNQAQDKFIDKHCVMPEKNVSPVEHLLADDCFAKPQVPKSKSTQLHSSSNPTTVSEPKQILDSGSKAIVEEDETVPSRKSSAKRKKSDETDSNEKETVKEISSSMSKRKSIAPKKSGRFSDAKSKKTQRKSIARTSFKKPLSPMVSGMDDQFSDISTFNSSSSGKKRTRNKSSVSYEKFFDTSDTEPTDDNFVVGRKVLNFFETRKSLVPNKRKFVFTNSTKRPALESTNPTQEADAFSSSTEIESQEKDIFEFSASELEDNSSNSKPKKQRKTSKRRKSSSRSQSKKEILIKKHCSEKISEPKQSNLEVGIEIENDAVPKKLVGISKPRKLILTSTASETTSEDSFVIGTQADCNLQVKELVNSKGDRIFSECSKSTRKTPSRHCKYPSHAEASSPPKENISNVESSVSCNDPSPSELTSPIQNNDKVSPPNKNSPIAECDLLGRDAPEGLLSGSSEVSEGKRKAKRTFSGVSERRSKKKSTLNPSDFLEEFDSATFSQGDPPKDTWEIDSTFSLECEMTEVYNFRDILNPETQESSNNQKQVVVVRDKNSTKKPDPLQITKDSAAFSNAETHAPTVSKGKKPLKDSHKEKADFEKLKKNDENSTKGTQPIEDPLISSLSSDKTKKTLKDSSREQVIVPLASENAKKALSDAETYAPIVSKSKKPLKDSYKKKADLIKKNEENSTKTTPPIEEAVSSDKTKKTLKDNSRELVIVPLTTGSSRDTLSDADTYAPIASKSKEPVKDSYKEKAEAVSSDKTKKTLKDNSQEHVIVPVTTSSSRDTLSDAETHAPITSKGEKTLKNSHKGKADLVKKGDETKATSPSDDALTSALSSDKTKKTLKGNNREKVILPLAIGSSKDALSDVETHAQMASKGKKPLKDSHKGKADLVKKGDVTKAPPPTDDALASALISDKAKKTLKDNSREQVILPLTTGSFKGALSDAESHALIASTGKKTLKDSHKGKADLVKKDDGNSTKATLCTEDALTSASSSEKTKKTLKDNNRKLAIEGERSKHVESAVTLAIDALCNTETNTPHLLGKQHEKKDSNQQQQHAAKENKHREDSSKKLTIKTKAPSVHEGAIAPSHSISKTSSTTNKISIFDKADFNAAHLDDLTNDDFVAPKSKKLYKEAPPAEKELLKSKPKKPRQKKSDLEDLKSKSKVPAVEAAGSSSKSVEGDRDPGSSGAAATVGMDEIVPAANAEFIPIHRLNCSGSIDSLCPIESKDNERRPSRRTKPSQSYKEPKLNSKMRR